MMFNPRYIFLIIWLLQVAAHSLDNTFYPFEALTWLLVAISMFAFMGGTSLGNAIRGSSFVAYASPQCSDAYIRNFFAVSYLIFLAAIVVATFWLSSTLGGLDIFQESATRLRQIVIYDFLGDRVILSYLRVYYFGVGLSLFTLAFSSRLGRGWTVLAVITGLLSALITTGRLYLLLFAAAGAALAYRQKLLSRGGLVTIALVFVTLFFAIAVLLSKGTEGATVMESVVWNARTYFMSSLACFNDFVKTNHQVIDGSALIPDFLRSILNNMGASIAMKPELLPFSYVPEPCNTYTVLFPYFHDGGAAGVASLMFGAGVLHQYLYKLYMRSASPVLWYLYAISLYPLIMMVFEDAYLSSYGFWLLLLTPPTLFCGIHWAAQTRGPNSLETAQPRVH